MKNILPDSALKRTEENATELEMVIQSELRLISFENSEKELNGCFFSIQNAISEVYHIEPLIKNVKVFKTQENYIKSGKPKKPFQLGHF